MEIEDALQCGAETNAGEFAIVQFPSSDGKLPGILRPSEIIEFYTALPYNRVMIFIETTLFTKLIPQYLSDDEYAGLQNYLLQYPDAGRIVRGSGGVRKVRWAAFGRGKSGGIRVIYYWKARNDEIWMLTVYGKNERDTIAPHILRSIAEEIQNV